MEENAGKTMWVPCPVCLTNGAHKSTQLFQNGAVVAAIEAIDDIEESRTND